jgi:hypothetical protein
MAKPAKVTSASSWFEQASSTFEIANSLEKNLPRRAMTLAWDSLHDLAKALAEVAGRRLEGESHGRLVDFLVCVFEPPASAQRAIRLAQTRRNELSYVRPTIPNPAELKLILRIAGELIERARPLCQPT